MTDINCSECCVHERNGKCTLSYISASSRNIGHGSNCAYFVPKASGKTPPDNVQLH